MLPHAKVGTFAVVTAALFWPQMGMSSCGGNYCSVNTQWETQGAWTGRGVRVNLHYAYIDLGQLRHGSNKAVPEAIPETNDERRTLDRSLLAGLDYAIDDAWSLSVQLPIIQRAHNHTENDTPPLREFWHLSGIGDLRLSGSRQFALSPDTSAGIRVGMKLPTGKIDDVSTDGELAERSLQLGSGSTDILLGAYYYRKLQGNATTVFAQTQWQRPLTERDHYEPGQQLSADMGLRYALTLATSAMLQLNLLWKDRDQGINAEPDETGGRYAYLSPGVSHTLSSRLQVFGFVQLPLYQFVNGTQLSVDKSATIGISWKL